MDPSSQPHAVSDEHQVLQLEEGLVVRTHRGSNPQGHRVVGIHETAARALGAADNLIADLGNQSNQTAEPCDPIEQVLGAELLPVVDKEWPLTVPLGKQE